MNFIDTVKQNFDSIPTSIAIQDNQVSISYAELGQLVAGINSRLKQLELEQGSYVGLYFESKPLAIASMIALLDYGCAYIPLDPIYPNDRLAYMLENANASFVLCDRVCEFAPKSTKSINFSQTFPTEETLEQVLANKSQAFKNFGIDSAQLEESTAAYLIYTSGSTGRPKGVAMPHGPLNKLIDWQNAHYNENYAPKTLQFSSLSFDVSFQEIFSSLSLGATLYTLDPLIKQDFKSLAEYILEHQIERIFMPYVALKNLMQWFVRLNIVPKSLKEVITA
ncbi:AMP-binding protein, partial [Oleiphilus sp. HI0061]